MADDLLPDDDEDVRKHRRDDGAAAVSIADYVFPNVELLSNPTAPSQLPDNIKVYGSVEEFDRNLPHTVTRLVTETGSVVYVVGTAHFSRESQDDVSLVSKKKKRTMFIQNRIIN